MLGYLPCDESKTKPIIYNKNEFVLNKNIKRYNDLIKVICKNEHLLFLDVFDDLIDHSYDNEPDLVTKIELALASITQLLGNDLDRFWLATHDRRKKNLDLMYDPDFKRFMSTDLFSRVS